MPPAIWIQSRNDLIHDYRDPHSGFDGSEALQQLDSDEAVYLLEDLDKGDQKDILAKLPYFERIALQRSLEYPEDSAGRIMQTDLIAVPPFWSVGQTIDYMRVAEDLPDRFYEIFVVDPAYRPVGTVPLSRVTRMTSSTVVSPRRALRMPSRYIVISGQPPVPKPSILRSHTWMAT